MEYIYAALLLHKANKEINEENVKKVMTAAGLQVDDARVKALVAALSDVNIEEAISKAVPVATATVGVEAKQEAAPQEEKKEEEKEISTEEAASGLSGLFG